MIKLMNCPVYVINMDSSIERWETTFARLQSIGMNATRISATVGKALKENEVAAWYDENANAKRHHRPLTPGEIGCYISHFKIWQALVEQNQPYCVVLEDDLTIESHLAEVLALIPKLKSWDMIKLSDDRANPFINQLSLSEAFTLGNYLKVPNGCQGYVISLEGAKKLLQRKPFFRPVDVDLQFHSEIGLRLFGIKPYPVAEDKTFESDIAKTNSGRHSSHSTFWKNLKYRIRMYLQRQKPSGDVSLVKGE
ncbi:glycosyl transferase, family 25 [Pseudoalteromonas luteoviolacea B = ATCC 29581]|nr:glycosyl transferase, family 25 [Pseudoalteromonas luteoviolacea B = ATCC 29581]